ncbi:uncharacterized protein M6B38_253395 [Iris pallida]|uniref:Syntaxin 6/10/61 N-terminal domain-containing protein n=1 Tax=Iris pallida TaxID=29817 RepID=A0AAX6IHQ6_IRIPA|nr:uncharacterized protein M6B38_253395 [Iris pallida]
MATCFDRWEKDPFFPAAEEVQESADRMESVYRRWMHERKDLSIPKTGADDVSSELLRDLQTALGTAKWQLEELARAVKSNDEVYSAGEDTRARHGQFVEAIGSQIAMVESSLKESNQEKGENANAWVRLDEGERDELALFLSCPLPPISGEKRQSDESGVAHSNLKEEKAHGHRRTASACADIASWKISLPLDDSLPNLPPPKTPSFSCLTKVLESTSKLNLSKNGFRKWKGTDQHLHDDSESIPLRNPQLSQGCNACYERSKSCLSCCGDVVYDKQLYGWLGALQRQLQRSQYQFQYGRPIQMIFWTILVVLLIVLLAFQAI